jgi:F420-non-reducing hydrogenase iron-sulfur subunit
MCSSRISPELITRALMNGLDGIMVLGCHPGDCHYQTGNYYARRRIAITKQLLEYIGVEAERVQLNWVSASEGRKFAEVVTKVTKELKEIGPNRLFTEKKISGLEEK